MSSMLEQAIIDAEQLKETAQRTAEEAVIEKYQSEIKEAVNAILEQEEPMEEETEAAAVIDGGRHKNCRRPTFSTTSRRR